MQKFLKTSFFLLLFASVVFSSFELKELDITIFVHEDGSAHVIEVVTILVSGNESLSAYSDYMSSANYVKNDIATWQSVLDNSQVTYHIGGGQVIITDLVITPGPFYHKNDYLQTAQVDMRLDYDVSAPVDDDPNTDLFNVDNIKPRTKKYTLNTRAFLFDEDSGDLIMPAGTTLRFTLPEDVLITNLKPMPSTIQGDLPIYGLTELEWSAIRLTEFTLVFEREETLETEIVEFFQSTSNTIVQLLQGTEGTAIVILVIVLVVTLIYLQRVKKR